jgi:hypothetical protein
MHNNLSRLCVHINGEAVTDFNCVFPNESANAYYNTLAALGLHNSYHNLKLKQFNEGRTIIVIDTTPDQNDDSLSVEKTGNVRITIQCHSALEHNSVIVLLGDTVAGLTVTNNRRVFADVLQ